MENTASGVEPSVDAYSKALFNAYVAFQRHYSKNPDYHGGTALTTACDKAAPICKGLKANPKEYIAAVFQGFGTDVKPNYIGCLKAQEYYRKAVTEYKARLPRMYKVQMGYLWDQLQTDRTVKNVLLDDRINFAPWFRIVISKEPIPEVMDKYLAQAKNVVSSSLLEFLQSEKLDTNRLM